LWNCTICVSPQEVFNDYLYTYFFLLIGARHTSTQELYPMNEQAEPLPPAISLSASMPFSHSQQLPPRHPGAAGRSFSMSPTRFSSNIGTGYGSRNMPNGSNQSLSGTPSRGSSGLSQAETLNMFRSNTSGATYGAGASATSNTGGEGGGASEWEREEQEDQLDEDVSQWDLERVKLWLDSIHLDDLKGKKKETGQTLFILLHVV
jgi:hypothetical protein